MSANKKFLLETDILTDHLINGTSGDSVLINIMQKGICFTTVLNASELLLAANSEKEQVNVNKVLNSLKVLGLNSRYALSAAKFAGNVNTLRNILFAVVADINKLPVVTFDIHKFSKTNLRIIHPQDLRG
jgi:predicted nucleic acid-binding protein